MLPEGPDAQDLLDEAEVSPSGAARAQAAVCRRELAHLDSLLDDAVAATLRASRHLRVV